jgi:hypothetical protein
MLGFIALIAVILFVAGLVTGKNKTDSGDVCSSEGTVGYELSNTMNPEDNLYDSSFRL